MKLHIISSFHYDYIYLQDSEAYFEISFRILDKALQILEKEEAWCFTIEQTILAEEYLKRFPEKKDAMKKFVRQGRIAFAPGMYVMPDMNMIDVESCCLQAKYGKKFLKETFGDSAEPKVCWIADCWGHHAQLPQILKSCGYEGYFFWRCMRRDVKKNDFYWQGLDGTKLLTHWTPLGYASISFPSTEAVLHAEELNFAEGTFESILALMEKLLPYHPSVKEKYPLLLCNGGDFRVPQETGPGVIKKLVQREDFPEAEFSTPDKFIKEMLSFHDLPTFTGEFNGSFQGTYSTNILIKQLLYYSRELLLAKETFAALKGKDSVDEKMWKQYLRHYFHDTVCGTVCDAGLKEAVKELQELRECASCKSNILFNPLLRERKEIVEREDGTHFLAELAPLESKNMDEFSLLPPLEEVNGENKNGGFQNKYYTCSWDEKGRIISLVTGKGKELVNKESCASFGMPVMNRDNGDNWIYYDSSVSGATAFTDNRADDLYMEKIDENTLVRSVYYPNIEECKVKRSEKECVIFQKGFLKFWRLYIPFTLQCEMDEYSPIVRFTLSIEPGGKYYRLRASFPTAVKNGSIHHGIPGGLQERSREEYAADGFIHYGDEEGGLFLLNRGLPGNNVDKNHVMLLSLFRSVAMEYKCDSTASFNEGVFHTFEYAVLPHDGEMYDEENAALIEEYLRPLQFVEEVYKGNWTILPANLHLYSIRKHPLGLFLRIGEVWGKSSSLALPGKYREADALENPRSQEKSAEVEFKPFALKNIILIRE